MLGKSQRPAKTAPATAQIGRSRPCRKPGRTACAGPARAPRRRGSRRAASRLPLALDPRAAVGGRIARRFGRSARNGRPAIGGGDFRGPKTHLVAPNILGFSQRSAGTAAFSCRRLRSAGSRALRKTACPQWRALEKIHFNLLFQNVVCPSSAVAPTPLPLAVPPGRTRFAEAGIRIAITSPTEEKPAIAGPTPGAWFFLGESPPRPANHRVGCGRAGHFSRAITDSAR